MIRRGPEKHRFGLRHSLRISKNGWKCDIDGIDPLILLSYVQLICVSVFNFRESKNRKKTIVVEFFLKLVPKAQKSIKVCNGELF